MCTYLCFIPLLPVLHWPVVFRSASLKSDQACSCLVLNPTGLQSEHFSAPALERPEAEAASGLQVGLAHRRSQDVQVSLETRPVLR